MLVIGIAGVPLTGLTTNDGIATAQEGNDEPEIEMLSDVETSTVYIHTNYDGSVSFLLGFNYYLESDEEREQFEEYTDDSDLQEEIADSFAEDMRGVATETDGADADGIHEPGARIQMTENGEVGFVDVWVEWDGLLSVENGELVMTEPFASGFGPQSDAVQSAGLPDNEEAAVGVEPTPVEDLVVWVPQRGADQFSSATPEPVETADEGHVVGLDMSEGFSDDFEIRMDPADGAEIGPDAGSENGEDGFSLDSPGQMGTYIAWTVTALALIGIVAGGVFVVRRYRR